ncbi:hypothetical protein AB0485_004011 [Vibrio parahaemolyticus]|nr:hypothetical protein [Vibrio parahaemolyticus]
MDNTLQRPILAGLKVWEMRSTKTKIRGTIALIEQGTGLIVGLANLTDSLEPLSHAELMANFDKHKVGAVIWVNI